MKLLTLIFTLVLSTSGFCKPVEIPRSEIVHVTEKSTSRVYSLYIKTPRSYATNTDKTYPVIYLTDAPYSFQLASAATRPAMNSGVMEEAIIVGIGYEKGSKGATSRVRDYTISNAAQWKMETGNAEKHAMFIRDEIFPFIEKNFRARADNRTFAGHSLGGLFGAYLLFRHPDMFANYIIGSPSVWFNNDELLAISMAAASKEKKVYLSVGSLESPFHGEPEDMVKGAKNLAAKIEESKADNVAIKFTIVDDGRHTTVFPTTLIQGLDWIMGKH